MQANSILFIDTVNELQAALDKAERAIKQIMSETDLGDLVAEVSDTNNRVTVLEPAVLNMRMKQITDICANIVLIGYVQQKDPKRELVDSVGNSWYELAKAPQLTVKAVKATREALDYRRIDIKDAKTIVELVRDGLL